MSYFKVRFHTYFEDKAHRVSSQIRFEGRVEERTKDRSKVFGPSNWEDGSAEMGRTSRRAGAQLVTC